MNISAIEIEKPRAENVKVTRDTIVVDLSDGRTIAVPLEWFPRLVKTIKQLRVRSFILTFLAFRV